MPRDITVTFKDGSTHVYKGAPDDVTPEQVSARAAQEFGREVTALDGGRAQKPELMQRMQNLAGGAVRGAGSIGATLLTPYDLLAGNTKSIGNPERRQAMDAALADLGVDTDSLSFGAGKLTTEVAGTLGVGNVLSRLAQAAGASPALVQSLATGGFRTGATPTNAVAKAADMGTRVVGGAVTGGASAGLVDPSQAGTGAAIGGVLPPATKIVGAAGAAAGKALRGQPASPEVVALAKRAAELGIDIPADRIAQSKPLDAVASGLNYLPFSGRAGTEARMSEQLNRALSKTFGQDTPNVTQALRKAETTLGGQFDYFLRNNTVALDKQFLDDLAEAANQASNELGTEGASIIAKQVDEIVGKGGQGAIDGQAAYNIKRTLDRIGRRSSPEAWYALDLKRKLMDALNRSVGPEKAQAFGELRKQYGNMLELQKLAKNGVDGEISVARLANLKNINNADLQELADIAAQFVKAREGQHGAMQRAAVGLASGATMGPAGVAGVAAAGRGANALLNSGAARSIAMGQPINALDALLNPEVASLGYRAAPVLGADR